MFAEAFASSVDLLIPMSEDEKKFVDMDWLHEKSCSVDAWGGEAAFESFIEDMERQSSDE